MTPLKFGVNPFDKCPDEHKRYHVVDPAGFILAKFDMGIIAYDTAGSFSDRQPDTTFTVIDTRDGSVYGAYRNGEDVKC